MVDPATATIIAGALAAGGSITGGILGRAKPKESKMERTKRHLVDKLISSLNGKGPYSDLYSYDEDTFRKSFIDPAMSRFKNQIAPQIQQQYIATGQQGGTNLDDQLLRAGVDLNSMLDQYQFQAQEGAQNRKQNTINSILGGGSGAPRGPSMGDAFQDATAGYLSSGAFRDTVGDVMKQYTNQTPQSSQGVPPVARKGFEPSRRDWSNWKLGDPRWGV